MKIDYKKLWEYVKKDFKDMPYSGFDCVEINALHYLKKMELMEKHHDIVDNDDYSVFEHKWNKTLESEYMNFRKKFKE